MATNKGFITDWLGNKLLPVTRGELVLDSSGNVALNSSEFLAGVNGAQFGLVTAAERAMLTGDLSGGSGGIADLYNKVNYINSGLKFNNSVLNFFDTDGTGTPINIVSQGDGRINITLGTDNIVNLGLVPLTTVATEISQLVRNISVDQFGRVTAVSGGPIVNSDIPYEIGGKVIKDSELSGCVVTQTDFGTDDTAIVNKAYVDSKFREVTGVATGALRFGGPLGDSDTAVSCLQSQHWYKYFKVTTEFYLNASDFYSSPEVGTSGTYKVKVGDTLIVYPHNSVGKFIYVPSGDDITTITVGKANGGTALSRAIGHVNLSFDGCFDVINPTTGSNTAKISILPASANQDGYLSKEDYQRFSSYDTAISYTGEFSAGYGLYKIGTLSINGVDNIIYGINNVSQLSVTDGTTNAYNPILKFTETGQADVDITLRGYNGVTVKRNGNTIEFTSDNVVLDQQVPQVNNQRTTKYLKITDGHKFEVQLGSSNSDGTVLEDGLTDYSQFAALVRKVSTNTTFEIINYSLSDEENADQYRYGNDKLKAAVTVTI